MRTKEVERWRSLVADLVSAWNSGWDCSRSPGHPEMNRAIAEAEIALSDATFGKQDASGGSYKAFLKGM